MDVSEIRGWPREERGSRACRRLRRQGLVPGILYGRHKPNILLVVREVDVQAMLEEHTFIARLVWDGQEEAVQLKELQVDEIGGHILHADFARISLEEKIEVEVPLEVRGEPAGVAEGGVLELQVHEIEVECMPGAIPESIAVDVSELRIGDALRVGDLPFPSGVTPTLSAETVAVTVVPPTEVPEEEEVPEEIVAEPEVIGREAEQEAGPGEEAEGRAAARGE